MAWHYFRIAEGCFFLSFFVLLVSSAPDSTLGSDVTALQGLRQAWNTTPGLIQNWTLGTDPCLNNWFGVSCFQESVIALRLERYAIVGTLPPSLGNLTNLLYLNLAGNPGLGGPIPEEIGKLTRLYALDLSNCSFSGGIPVGLGRLRNSSFIYLNNNHLNGELPFTLGQLSRVYEFSAAHNNISGNIPISTVSGSTVGLNNMTSLMILDLGSNNLGGEIPPSLGQLGNLTTLFLESNNFSGCLGCATASGESSGLDNLTKISQLDLSSNAFTGPLPDFLLSLPLINKLNLSFNQFTGVLNGSMRQGGHVNIFLNNNNISAVADLPNPFIDPVLGGNPVCNNQSFPFANICKYSGTIPREALWQQQTSCTNVCGQNSVLHPTACTCSYPLICNMYFGWSPTFGLAGARIGDLRRAIATDLNISSEQIWVEHAMFQNSSETNVLAKILFYPRTQTPQWVTAEVVSIQSQLGNRTVKLVDYNPYGLSSATLRVPPVNKPVNEGTSNITGNVKHNHKSLPTILGAIGGVLGFVAIAGVVICLLKRQRTPRHPSVSNGSEIFDFNSQQFPSCLFAYEEVKSSTRNFSRGNKIGEGTFGPVYKATLRDGTEVAVKELPSNIKQNTQDFLDEVQSTSGLQHKNLVKLRGCSMSSNSNRLLIYEYVENKSLAQALFDPTKAMMLEWPFRYNIALGMAKGLAYLHSKGHRQRLAHGDIKASSVLLDRHLEPKIADFGLARLCQANDRKVHARIDGKRGYVAPEFALHGQLTPKTDVFSFGIVALELVTGRENMNPTLPKDEQYLLAWAWQLYEQNQVLDLVDPKVKEGSDDEQAGLLIKVALLCSQGDPSSRPNMVRVVSLLSGDSDVPEVPVRPAFLGLGVTDPNKPATRPSSLTTWK